MSLKPLLNRNPVTVTEYTSIRDTAQLMLEENVGFVIVLKKADNLKPCGIVTDRDIALKLAENSSSEKLLIKDIVLPKLVSISHEKSIKKLTEALCDNRIRRIVVVDDSGNLAGLVSVDDLLILLTSELQDIKKTIESQVCW